MQFCSLSKLELCQVMFYIVSKEMKSWTVHYVTSSQLQEFLASERSFFFCLFLFGLKAEDEEDKKLPLLFIIHFLILFHSIPSKATNHPRRSLHPNTPSPERKQLRRPVRLEGFTTTTTLVRFQPSTPTPLALQSYQWQSTGCRSP